MPKVTDEYLSGKRNFILECTEEVLNEKPLYLITMRDIIKQAGFSQGVIYRYYSSIDEIYVDFINRYTADTDLEQRLNTILTSDQPETTVIFEYFEVMGEYIADLLNSPAGKPIFELLILYSSDHKRRNEVFPKLRFKQNLEYLQNKIVQYALINMEKGVFRFKVPFHSLMSFVSVFIDGVAQSVVFNATEGNSYGSTLAADIPEMFKILAQAVVGFLEI